MRTMIKIGLAASAGVIGVGAVGGYVLARPSSKALRTEAYDVPAATVTQLKEIAGLRIFFGHQSVGRNLLDATPDLFSAADVPGPEIVESVDAGVVTGPMITHSFVGRNRYPLEKIEEFDRIMRDGMGGEVDVALLKLCYIDVRQGVDIQSLFATYRDTMAALERDYPDVTFLYSTVPLTTEFGGPFDHAKRRIKDLIGRDNLFAPAHNVAREKFNTLIRDEFGNTGRLFDIAAIQSTGPDGMRQVRSHSGWEYFAMEDAIASDSGHLDHDGSLFVAGALFALIAGEAS